MTNWKEYKLGEIANDVSYGYTESANEKPVGPKFLRITDIREGSINWETVPYCPINEKDYIKNKLEIGDIVVARTGATTGITETIKHNVDAVFASYLIRFRINKEIANPFYVGYVLKSTFWKEYVGSIVSGSAQPGANAKQFSDFSLNIPDLPTQTAIAEILSSLDDKIELNNKINQELENLAQTLFKQWFIDFEFPNDNGEPYKSSGGEMVDSELGEIPKGWEIATIEDITEIVTKGTTPTTIGGKFTASGINFIKVESLTEQGAFIKSKFGFIDEETNQLLRRSIIQEGDVLFSIAGTIGRVAVVTKDILPANTNQAIAIIRPNKVDSNFLKLLMKSALIQNDTQSNVVQAVQANLSLGVIKATKFIKPSIPILSLFKSTLSEIFENVNLLTEETQELTNLRDTLLPKLISGELEVAEVMAEKA
jgi:type I restriction enzyme S subunit